MGGLAELQRSLAAAFSSFAQLSEYPLSLPSLPAGVNPVGFFPCFRTFSHIKLKHTESLFGLAGDGETHP